MNLLNLDQQPTLIFLNYIISEDIHRKIRKYNACRGIDNEIEEYIDMSMRVLCVSRKNRAYFYI